MSSNDKEDYEILENKTKTITIRNPNHPDIDEENHRIPSEEEYKAVRKLRESDEIDFNELLSKYLYAVYRYEFHDESRRIYDLVEEINDIEEITYPDYIREEVITKTTKYRLQNPLHSDNDIKISSDEYKWYKALYELRKVLGRDIIFLPTKYCEAVVKCIEEDNCKEINELKKLLLK